MRNPKIVQFEWIGKWDGKLSKIMMDEGQGSVLDLNESYEVNWNTDLSDSHE